MRKFDFRSHKIVFSIILIIIALFVLYGGHYLYQREKIAHNHDLVSDYINTALTFTADARETEKQQLIEYTTWTNLSDADRGWVYERLSLIYQTSGDTVLYYDALGKALYYLEKGGSFDNAANIYADLANYYFTHSESDMAQSMLDRIYSQTNVDNLERGQIKSYIYRLQALINIENEDYDNAFSNLEKASSYIYEDEDSIYYGKSYEAITNVALAKCYFKTNQYDKCREIINQYENSDFFTTDIYADIVARDFIIPYYETAINITVYDNDEKRTDEFLHEFINKCTEYGYQNIELSQLTYMQKSMPSDVARYTNEVDAEIRNCYDAINKELYARHALLIDSQIAFAKQNEYNNNSEVLETKRKFRNTFFIIASVLLLLILLFNLSFQSRKDALTRIGNRRALNARIKRFNKNGNPYTVIMIDIDNFKKVNDTYGHEKGDEVLVRLGKILKDEGKEGFKPYRYGGEEFLVFLDGFNVNKAIQKADHIRYIMENQTWDGINGNLTISLGVAAKHHSGEDVIKCADENLYYSKQNGKNVVTYSDHGYQTLYKADS